MPQAVPTHSHSGTRPISIREAHKQLTRDRLIDTAIAVIVDRGFQATTIEEIASRANVGRTTVYKYFRGKSDIATAISERYSEQLIEVIASISLADPGDLVQLNEWLLRFEALFSAQPSWFLLAPPTPEGIMRSLRRQDAAAEQILQEWAARGWRPAVAAPAQSLRLLFNLVGRWLSYHAVFGVPEPEHSREALIELVDCEITRIVRKSP